MTAVCKAGGGQVSGRRGRSVLARREPKVPAVFLGAGKPEAGDQVLGTAAEGPSYLIWLQGRESQGNTPRRVKAGKGKECQSHREDVSSC